MPRQKSTHVDSPEAVGRRLKAAREAAGLSQRQLSFPGCSPAYISRIESGDRIPSLQLLRELGKRLGVSEDYLATGAEAASNGPGATLVEAEVAMRLDDLELADQLLKSVLETATEQRSRAGALTGLGQLAYRRGDPLGAVRYLEEALGLYRPEAPERPAAEETLGRAYAMLGKLDAAVAVFERGLDRADRFGDPMEIVRFSVLLAYALIDSADFDRAEVILGRALELGKDSVNPSVRLQLYWSQAKLYVEQGDPETAATYARKAYEILSFTEDTARLARVHQLLAQIELERGRPEEALQLLEEGWPLLAKTGNPVERAHYRIEEARVLARLERKEEAAALALQVTGVLANARPEDAARAYTLTADVFAELGESERALELYELAIEMLERNPNRYLLEAYTKLAELLEASGRRDDAFAVMKKALAVDRARSRS
jgi:tetratricopeptide (TPR) repeat protein